MRRLRSVGRAAAAGAVGRAAERLSPFGPALAVLVYHRVVPERRRDPWSLAVSEANFRDQIAALRDRWPVVPLEHGLRGATEGTLPAKHAVAVTFDDGYRDNLTRALPVLDTFAIPATLFLATGYVSKDSSFWWDRLDTALAEGRLSRPRADVYRWGKGLTSDARDRWLQSEGVPQRVGEPEDQPMTAEDLQRLGARFRIAGHGHDHVSLGLVPVEDAARDLATCMYTLSHVTETPLRHVAYPFGGAEDVTEAVASSARDAGFLAGFTTSPGVVRRGADLFRLPRIWAHDVSGAHLVAALTRAFLSPRRRAFSS
jgi:peptidoglycan/xylan/chitin deacetylase (PgdA/CDA1 family)